MTNSIAVRLRSETSEFAKVRDQLDRLGRQYVIPERDLMELQIAADEIVSNVIKYSWADDLDHEFLVRITLNADAITLQIIDDGSPFDPRSAPAPSHRPRADRLLHPGGVGIDLVRKLVDGFDYRRVRGYNQTTLTKKIATEAVQGKG